MPVELEQSFKIEGQVAVLKLPHHVELLSEKNDYYFKVQKFESMNAIEHWIQRVKGGELMNKNEECIIVNGPNKEKFFKVDNTNQLDQIFDHLANYGESLQLSKLVENTPEKVMKGELK